MIPTIPITNPAFVYRPAANTNVQDIWRKHGWVPPSEVEKK